MATPSCPCLSLWFILIGSIPLNSGAQLVTQRSQKLKCSSLSTFRTVSLFWFSCARQLAFEDPNSQFCQNARKQAVILYLMMKLVWNQLPTASYRNIYRQHTSPLVKTKSGDLFSQNLFFLLFSFFWVSNPNPNHISNLPFFHQQHIFTSC
jgi:hypothetical protein